MFIRRNEKPTPVLRFWIRAKSRGSDVWYYRELTTEEVGELTVYNAFYFIPYGVTHARKCEINSRTFVGDSVVLTSNAHELNGFHHDTELTGFATYQELCRHHLPR